MSKIKQTSALPLTENNSFSEITTQLMLIENNSNSALGVVQDVQNLSRADQYMLVASRVLTGNDVCTAIYKLSGNNYIAANNEAKKVDSGQMVQHFTSKNLGSNNRQSNNNAVNSSEAKIKKKMHL